MSTNIISVPKEKNKLGSLVKAFRKYYVPFIVSIVLLIVSVVFTILTPGTICWKAVGNQTRTIEYKINDGEWTSITST